MGNTVALEEPALEYAVALLPQVSRMVAAEGHCMLAYFIDMATLTACDELDERNAERLPADSKAGARLEGYTGIAALTL